MPSETNGKNAFDFLILLVMTMPCLVCFGIAANILLTKGGETQGWGWLLLIGLIMSKLPIEQGAKMLN